MMDALAETKARSAKPATNSIWLPAPIWRSKEMALRIGDDGQIAVAFPVIELHHSVFRAPRKTLLELVANNGLNAGIVGGCPAVGSRQRQRAQFGRTMAGFVT
jgi:hypothetical protein